MDSNVLPTLYKTLVRPLLAHFIQARNTYLKHDIVTLDKGQRRTTKIVSGFENVFHEERLKRHNLTKTKTKRVRGNLI